MASTQNSNLSLDERVRHLRQEVERVVKPAGAKLRSAPFQSATVLQSLNGGAEVVIVVDTHYWYGIETEDGQHGWIHRSELESVP